MQQILSATVQLGAPPASRHAPMAPSDSPTAPGQFARVLERAMDSDRKPETGDARDETRKVQGKPLTLPTATHLARSPVADATEAEPDADSGDGTALAAEILELLKGLADGSGQGQQVPLTSADLMAALIQAGLAAGGAVPVPISNGGGQPAPDEQQSQSGQGPPTQLPVSEIRIDAGLQAFIRKAVADLVQGSKPVPANPTPGPAPDSSLRYSPDPGPARGSSPTARLQSGPTFTDLIQLVAAQGRGERSGTAGSGTGGEAGEHPLGLKGAPAPADGPDQLDHPDAPDLPDGFLALLEGHKATHGLESAAKDSPSPTGAGRFDAPDPDQVMKQVSRSVQVMLEGRRSEVKLQLHPEHLGSLTVKLIVEEGVVQANISARDPQVRQVLQANLDQLRTRFAEQGFKIDQVHVSVGGDTQFDQSQQSHQGGQAPSDHPEHGFQERRQRLGQGAPPQEPRAPRPEQRWRTWNPGQAGARINSLA